MFRFNKILRSRLLVGHCAPAKGFETAWNRRGFSARMERESKAVREDPLVFRHFEDRTDRRD
jgi:hypothetical protein